MSSAPRPPATEQSAASSGPVRRLTDALLTRPLHLPARRTRYGVTRGLRIPMRDGTVLLADLHRPTDAPARGTVLVRTPYIRAYPYDLHYARIFAARGYDVLLQSVRGTFGSEGAFTPFVNEVDDAHDTVAWLRQQEWFQGHLATVGSSYQGWTQWALHSDPPPELQASVVVVGPHDMAGSMWGTGSFAWLDYLGWSDLVVHQEQLGLVRTIWRLQTATRRLRPLLDRRPVLAAAQEAFAGQAPWLPEWLTHPDLDDPYWNRCRLGAAVEQTRVPTLLIGGWQDMFLTQTLEQYRIMSGNGVDVGLTVGPWVHLDLFGRAGGEIATSSLTWLDEHMGDVAAPRISPRPVRYFLTGAQAWQEAPSWPPATRERIAWLTTEGTLVDEAPDATRSGAVTVRLDPRDPPRAPGGRILTADAGVGDNRVFERRSDVLGFTSAALTADMDVLGAPTARLVIDVDRPGAPVFVRLCDVDPEGTSRTVSDGLGHTRDAGGGQVTVTLDDCAHRLRAGHRLRLLISGGNEPRFVADPRQPADAPVVTYAIDLTASSLGLPVSR